MFKIILLLLIGGSEKMIQTLSGFLTPIIAIITTLILFWQFRLEKNRWRLALYDKRYQIYLATMQYLSFIMQYANLTDEELFKFLRNSKDKEFLFGDDIKHYLEELYKKGNDLRLYNTLRKNETIEEKRVKAIEKEHELLEWFSKQLEESKKIFGEYLTIDKK
jgi:hypothetical protein